MLSEFQKVLDRLDVTFSNGDKAMARCPGHDDKNPSLSVKAEGGRLLLHCFGGCTVEEVMAAIDLPMSALFSGDLCTYASGSDPIHTPSPPQEEGAKEKVEAEEGEGGIPSPSNHGALVHKAGCTLEEYAEATGLEVEVLKGLGLSQINYQGSSAVRMVYADENGQELAVRFRLALDGPDKFRWRRGDKAALYGLPLLRKAREAGYVVLVEGESDCHTLWFHGVPAVGVPGASTWRSEWSERLDGIEKVYVVVEPDAGGETLWDRMAASPIRERLYRVELDGVKDVSELHLKDAEHFANRLKAALDNAISFMDIAESEAEESRRKAWSLCEDLANEDDILARFAEDLARLGVAGEEKTAKILFLAVVSRRLDKPVSVVLKGPSASGKSYTVEQVLRFFPESAFYALTAMSEHAMAYDNEPLKHRMLVIYEASGMEGDLQTYMIRSLLSEGRVRYVTVVKGKHGPESKVINREGPTGLIVTTTATRLHPENETRLMSLTVTDTQEQTRDVLMALAEEDEVEVDFEPWMALQEWLERADSQVTIAYAKALAGLVPPRAVRLRRDFGAVLNLVRAHAVLHQAARPKWPDGRITATYEDYGAVRELVVDLVSAGVGATVPPTVRQAVKAVKKLLDEGDEQHVTTKMLVDELKLDQSSVYRRTKAAIEAGYLRNLEERQRQPARLVLGDQMPEDVQILPTVKELRERVAEHERARMKAAA